jgi:hypothetical protein
MHSGAIPYRLARPTCARAFRLAKSSALRTWTKKKIFGGELRRSSVPLLGKGMGAEAGDMLDGDDDLRNKSDGEDGCGCHHSNAHAHGRNHGPAQSSAHRNHSHAVELDSVETGSGDADEDGGEADEEWEDCSSEEVEEDQEYARLTKNTGGVDLDLRAIDS